MAPYISFFSSSLPVRSISNDDDVLSITLQGEARSSTHEDDEEEDEEEDEDDGDEEEKEEGGGGGEQAEKIDDEDKFKVDDGEGD